MLRRGFVLTAALLLGGATGADAQLPRGNRQITFVPIDTTKNLATPVPSINSPQPKDSPLGRLYKALRDIIPFTEKSQRNPLPAPLLPIVQAPRGGQPPLPQGQSSPSISLPQLPPLISGSAR